MRSPTFLGGLEHLEYRGHDNSTVAVLGEGSPFLMRLLGSTSRLKERIGFQTVSGTMGIGHTRWLHRAF